MIRYIEDIPDVPKPYKIYLDDYREAPDSSWYLIKDPYHLWSFRQSHRENITDISFDHDLGCINQFGEEVTGYDVLTWILHHIYSNNNIKLPTITFHTSNPVGRQNMRQQLEYFTKLLKERDGQ